jgi:hypothetical protein
MNDTSYGGYYGGDPRHFHPDEERCTAAELSAHRAACDAWARGETPDARIVDGVRTHCDMSKPHGEMCPRPFGIGITVFPAEIDDESEMELDLDLDEMEDEDLLRLYLSNSGHDSDEAMRILASRHHATLAYDPDENDL